MGRLSVLMYHNICEDNKKSSGLTISVQKLEEQFKYLSQHYHSLFVSELENQKTLPGRTVVITFDDVTENQLLLAVPLLQKYNLKATFFVPFNYIGKHDLWNKGTEKIMTIEQLKSLPENVVELGHHSYNHNKYSQMSNKDIHEDFRNSYKVIQESGLKVYPALAYPYGNYPKSSPDNYLNFIHILKENNIKMAFKIGNRPNLFPIKDNYQIKRIDVKGEDSLFTFKLKVKVGKLKLF